MRLIDIINALSHMDPDEVVRYGFDPTQAHSYRGDYRQLAFPPDTNVMVKTMVAGLKGAIGKTFEGWKGGEFEMDENVHVFISNIGEGSGDEIGQTILKYWGDKRMNESLSREEMIDFITNGHNFLTITGVANATMELFDPGWRETPGGVYEKPWQHDAYAMNVGFSPPEISPHTVALIRTRDELIYFKLIPHLVSGPLTLADFEKVESIGMAILRIASTPFVFPWAKPKAIEEAFCFLLSPFKAGHYT